MAASVQVSQESTAEVAVTPQQIGVVQVAPDRSVSVTVEARPAAAVEVTESVTHLTFTPAQVPQITIQSAVPSTTIEVCRQGPPGPQGIPGPVGSQFSVTAAVPLGGHRVIALNADRKGVYADQADVLATTVVGFSASAAVVGDGVMLVQSGPLEYPAGGLTPEQPVFLGSDGLITQTPPSSGWLLRVGTALATDYIAVDIGPAYWLGV